jgi:hypothetical protein
MGTEEERRLQSRAGELINYLSIYGIELELNSPEKERRRDGSARARASRYLPQQPLLRWPACPFPSLFKSPTPRRSTHDKYVYIYCI